MARRGTLHAPGPGAPGTGRTIDDASALVQPASDRQRELAARDALDTALRLSPAAALGVLGATAAVVGLAWGSAPHNGILAWALVGLGATAAIGLVERAHGLAPTGRRASARTTQMMLPAGILGAVWGSAGLIRPTAWPAGEWSAVAFALAALVSACVAVAFAPVRRVALAFLAPCWAVACVVTWGADERALAATGGLLLLVMVVLNAVAHDAIEDAFVLRHSNERLNAQVETVDAYTRLVTEMVIESIWTVNRLGVILSANPAALSMMRCELDEAIGRPLATWLDDAVAVQPGVRGRQCEIVSSAGDRHPVVVSSLALGDVGAEVLVVARDISERRARERRLDHDARHDSLTGLPNRVGILAELGEQHTRCTALGCSLVVLAVGIDGLERVNEVFGHEVGDRVVRETARRLRERLGRTDSLGRLGGNSFVIVLPDVPCAQDIDTLIADIVAGIEQPYADEAHDIRVSARVGLAWATPSTPAEELLENTEFALRCAEHEPVEQVVVFDRGLKRSADERARTSTELRRAADRDEFEAWGQPIISFTTGRPVGVELLARWRRGEELLGPDRFLELAHESGVIAALGRYMTRQAVLLLSTWRSDPALRRLYVTVNVSGRHLVGRDLAADVADALRIDVDCAPQLVLELNDTHLAGDPATARRALQAVRQLGVGVAIDDFGTGYTSLSYLQDLPSTMIKVDRSFLASLPTDPRQQDLVRSVVEVAGAFRQRVIAEGVETFEQADVASRLGVNFGQGFFFARPMPLAELQDWLLDIQDRQSTRAG